MQVSREEARVDTLQNMNEIKLIIGLASRTTRKQIVE